MVMVVGLTLGPAIMTVASRFGLLDPKREFNYRRWRRLGTAIVRWPAPILAAALALAIIGALGLAGFNPLYNERYYLPNNVPSKEAYDAVGKHFTEARLNPDLLMIETDHDLRNPRDLLVLDRVAKNIFRLPGIERVQSITRPLGPPIEHGSVPFQLSMQSAPIRDNLQYLKDRIADIKKITDDLSAMIAILERTYDLTRPDRSHSRYNGRPGKIRRDHCGGQR
jgi:RND superfamily putative drug exporter